MTIADFFHDYGLLTIFVLTAFSFIAGFIDSIVGGGGLIQIPALLIGLPKSPLPVLFGTNKIAALSGTTIAAIQYSRRVKYDFRLLMTVSVFAFVSSNLGARAVSAINPDILKPVILFILIAIAIYTFVRKDLGSVQTKSLSLSRQIVFGSLAACFIGFYDGFFGPGTGSFLILAFVVILGFDFLKASAYAKVINCVTNLSALVVFILQGSFIPGIAILMAVGNISGSLVGSRMALRKGNRFIRVVFLVIVALLIVRYGYEVVK